MKNFKIGSWIAVLTLLLGLYAVISRFIKDNKSANDKKEQNARQLEKARQARIDKIKAGGLNESETVNN